MLFSGWGLGQPMTTSQSQLHARIILFLLSLFSFHLIPASAVSCKVLVGRQQRFVFKEGFLSCFFRVSRMQHGFWIELSAYFF